MYFPYLRGKQFELLALRELVSLLERKRDKISPIIEPVKNTSGLITAFSELRKSSINFNVIINPSVGDMVTKSEEILNKISHLLTGYENFQLAILVESGTDYERLFEFIQNSGISNAQLTFVHNEMNDDIKTVQEHFCSFGPIINNVINFRKTGPRYYREFDNSTRVSLYDYFGSLPKNADYLKQEDSSFSDEYKFYRDEGYRGFGDFLTIGDNYTDSGRLPWAVAIHISYLDPSGRIRVKHFVSDSNNDSTDVAGKFAEANGKLVVWCNANGVSTLAIDKFRQLHEIGHFPGLGTVKKLSIMNHIELVLGLI